MATIDQIAARWVRDCRSDSPRFLNDDRVNVKVRKDWDAKHARLFSYGTHFELARWVPATVAVDGFWLLNGDRFSVSTSRHQRSVLSAVTATKEPVLILPFTTLGAAGIDLDSIAPVEITKDRMVPDPRTGSVDILPAWMRGDSLSYYVGEGTVTDHGAGIYTHHRTRHVLGESLFAADSYGRGRHLFLSAFDAQETRAHYFLCELPETNAATVAEAFDALRPAGVTFADQAGVQVTRQGDIFAVPTVLGTRELKAAPGATHERCGRLLGTSHTATDVITNEAGTYARGILTHRPTDLDWRTGRTRAAEHRRQAMGDRKTWHLIVQNTVPKDAQGNSRAWSIVGNVD